MGFNQFSQAVQRPDVFKPLSDELILSVGKAQYDRASENAKKLGGYNSKLFGITTYGKDAEELAKMEQQFQSEASELAKHNLAGADANSRISSLVTKYSTNPDFRAITERANFHANESEKEKDALARGTTYVNPNKRKLDEYYSGDTYYTKPEGINMSSGYTPDLVKWQSAAQKQASTTQKRVEKIDPGTGVVTYQMVEVQTPEDLKNSYRNILTQDPNGRALLDDNFNQNYEGYDFDKQGKAILHNQLYKLEKDIYDLESMGEDASEHRAHFKRLQEVDASGITGEPLKQKMKEDWIDKFTGDWANSVDIFNEGEEKMSQLEQLKWRKKEDAIERNARAAERAAENALRLEMHKEDLQYKQDMNELKLKSAADLAEAKRVAQEKKDALEAERNKVKDANAQAKFERDMALIDKRIEQIDAAKDAKKENPKEKVRHDTGSVRQIFNDSKGEMYKALSKKMGGDGTDNLGFNFDANDINSVIWNDKTNRYELNLDSGTFSHGDVTFTEEEFENLQKGSSTPKVEEGGDDPLNILNNK